MQSHTCKLLFYTQFTLITGHFKMPSMPQDVDKLDATLSGVTLLCVFARPNPLVAARVYKKETNCPHSPVPLQVGGIPNAEHHMETDGGKQL